MPNLANAQKFSHDESGRHAPRESWPYFGNKTSAICCLPVACMSLSVYSSIQGQRSVAHVQPAVLMMGDWACC